MECHRTYLTDPSQTKSATPSPPAAITFDLPHVNTVWRVCTRTITLLFLQALTHSQVTAHLKCSVTQYI